MLSNFFPLQGKRGVAGGQPSRENQAERIGRTCPVLTGHRLCSVHCEQKTKENTEIQFSVRSVFCEEEGIYPRK